MNFRALVIVGIVGGCLVSPGDGAEFLVKRDTIFLNGQDYRLEESVPVISALLNSSSESEQIKGLRGVRSWAWQLEGSDLVVRTIELFNGSNNYDVRATALLALCAVGDRRAEGVFEKASKTADELFNVVGCVGLVRQRGPEAIPQLVEAMANTHDLRLIRSARVSILRLELSDFDWPDDDVWKSEAKKKTYLQGFARWWQTHKALVDAKWEALVNEEKKSKEAMARARAASQKTDP